MPGKCNLLGQRFGMLTVIKKEKVTQDRYALWLCKCDCGGEIQANTRRLKRGTVSNCGCIAKKTARNGNIAEDLVGRHFGELTVLKREESQKGRTRWLCRCVCGKTCIVTSHSLKNGHTKSCGCRQHKIGCSARNIEGQRFGRLTAKYMTEKRDGKGSVFWHCLCDCGNEVDVTEDCLIHGNYRSCGCLQQEIRKDIHNKLTLIDGTCVEMLEKRKHRSDNKSGFRGVTCNKNGTYSVNIGFKGKNYFLGRYHNFSEAVSVRQEAEKRLHDGFVKAYYDWKKTGKTEGVEEEMFVYEAFLINGEIEINTNIDVLLNQKDKNVKIQQH